MNTLDRDRLKSLILTLEQALMAGFSSLSSPTEILLDATIDMLLSLAFQLEEGHSALRQNPELIFLDNAKADPLGNSKQISIRKKEPNWYDPEVAEYIRQLATLMVGLKNRHSLSDALIAADLADGWSSTQHKVETTTSRKKSKSRTKSLQARRAYQRRQRLKKRLH